MNTVVGEMDKQQSNDFSKIQARFATRMKLTSADVAEVIQKRLLMKNDDGVDKLSEVYHAQSKNFKTLFDFADGSQTYRNFQDREHFIHCYPFIPYQFALFQAAIQNLSLHSAFEGKHSSVGERSMLGVFQQVVIHISEQEIKNTEVESADIADELAKIIFDNIIKDRKIRYDNGQDYPFSRKLDDRLVGREYELAIHVVSPFHEDSDREDILRMQSMGRADLMVMMPPDERLVRDILMYKRTEKYIRQNISITQQDAIKRILTDKSFQNRERYADLQQHISSLLGKAKLFVMGDETELSSEDAQSRIIRGFHELILRAYPNLRMLRGISYTENDIEKCLKQYSDGLFSNDATQLDESEQETLAFIQGNSRGGVRTTLKSLVEKFERKPYGWYFAAILCILAKLCARGKVEVRSDGNLLEDANLERALRNTHGHANVVLVPQIDFTASQVRQLKEFYEDFFDEPPQVSEARALGKETASAFEELLQKLTNLAEQTAQYPFLAVLEQPMERLKGLADKSYTFYLTELGRQEDSLLDQKENILDPVRRFMSGPMKGLYDEARKFLQAQEPNFAYVKGDEAQQIQDTLNDAACFKGNRMQQAKALVDALKTKVTEQLQQEKAKAEESVNSLKERMTSMEEFEALSSEQQGQLIQPFDQFIRSLERQTLIAVIRDTLRHFEEDEHQRLLTKMGEWAQPEPGTGLIAESKVEYVTRRSIHVPFDKAWLADEADVDRYLAALREAMMKEISAGKRVQI
nr:BREX system P-loop protein BrxC [bacterium]